jgi:hypothetical protein
VYERRNSKLALARGDMHVISLCPIGLIGTQPSELVWTMTKGHVGTAWYPERTLKATLEQWHVALYGGEIKAGVEPEVIMLADAICNR